MINLWLVYFDEKTNLDVEVTISHQLGGWVSLKSSYNTVVGRMDSFRQNCIPRNLDLEEFRQESSGEPLCNLVEILRRLKPKKCNSEVNTFET